jgi:soluble lytic murein transglycosylase
VKELIPIRALIAATALVATTALAATTTPLPRPRPDGVPKIAKVMPKPDAKAVAKSAPVISAPSAVAKLPDIPVPNKRPAGGDAATSAFAQAAVGLRGSLAQVAKHQFKPLVRPASGPFALANSNATPPADVAAVKRVLEFCSKAKDADANETMKGISDPVARKLAEWMYLRSYNTTPSYYRFAAFINTNPAWPHVPMFRRRAENALWDDKIDLNTVRSFFTQRGPTTAKGKFMLARAYLASGDQAKAQELVRSAWREDDFSAAVERIAGETFAALLTTDDWRLRMEARLYVDDAEAGLRAAEHVGGSALAIAKARAAVIHKAGNAKALLDAIPAADRKDAGYIFHRAVWLRRNDQIHEAGQIMLTAPTDPKSLVDLDQWWVERRLLVRKLLDEGEHQIAYRVSKETPPPAKGIYKVDQQFTAGWIALRYLHDPQTAAVHFAGVPEGTENPHALSRGGYWQGRTAEALGRKEEARQFYETAAGHSATYYGQLARARLGLPELGLRPPPQFTAEEAKVLSNLEVVRAVDILYSIGERDLVAPIFAELGESGTDVAGMAMLGELAGRNGDGRAMLLLGKGALSRGLPLDYYAYPTIGLPEYKPIAPAVGPAVTYAIARQESHFNQKVVSPANAMGFMQVTPAAAKDTAKRFKAVYDKNRLLSDPVYNMQMGDAELSALINGYRGSYILTFAGYNAGRGRVRQWIAAFGDPRDPKVDPIDWVERIPIAETRNYVQRIMENLQVYRVRFGGGSKLLIEADLHRDTGAN